MPLAETKTCPLCAEDIKAAAVKCKHCGSMLEESAAAPGPPREKAPPASPPPAASGAPVEVRRAPRLGLIVVGALLLGGAVWLWLEVGLVTRAGTAAVVALGLFGPIAVVTGLRYPVGARGTCPHCSSSDSFRQTLIGWKCAQCRGLVATEATAAVLIIALVVAGVVGLLAPGDSTEAPGKQESAPRRMLGGSDDSSAAVPKRQGGERSEEVIDKQITVEEDHYRGFAFELRRDARVSIRVVGTGGPDFEALTMKEAQFRIWEEEVRAPRGREFRYFPELSAAGVARFEGADRLAAGMYYVVVDNSDQGEVAPPSNLAGDTVEATVHVEVEP